MFVRLDFRVLFAFTHSYSVGGKNILAPLTWVGSLFEYKILLSLKPVVQVPLAIYQLGKALRTFRGTKV